ncbi:DUF397 domain-containing protein [Actinomadura vinacea]|uniref:DUF397 domain-containing protein n=1 Tax=Actinomadura vinacea TaxID=115336 RepID=UPI0031D931DC
MRSVWRKSSRSDVEGNSCVEVARLSSSIGVRDSKAPDAGHLVLGLSEWRGLVGAVRAGSLELPR